ncbi:Rrf2 family transcriptional regulator [Roseibium sp. CAU 1637]|uniref:Rrf2 family transcriptional regulator n=1 Tax=Roseibium limicola TaxID=2816037 RepID=A0A939J908_9HYPH|nr:Rrf2 family transcriptional regulator [Roseibium limicola]MBO0344903.1 Rrf2 family transcriptional regulator [Roseibium limicola]
MRRDSRLSRTLHLLLHMERFAQPATSEHLAGMLQTNPVVVRRMMQGLKAAGLVQAARGHGGGWTLGRPLVEITLLNVHEALGSTVVFNIGLSEDDPKCLVEQAVKARLSDAMEAAEKELLDRFAGITLAEISQDFEERMQGLGLDAALPPICQPPAAKG